MIYIPGHIMSRLLEEKRNSNKKKKISLLDKKLPRETK